MGFQVARTNAPVVAQNTVKKLSKRKNEYFYNYYLFLFSIPYSMLIMSYVFCINILFDFFIKCKK